MNEGIRRAQQRFLATLEIVRRELRHLQRSHDYLAGKPLDSVWVEGLEENADDADRLEAFVSRYGRLQDTIGARLIPRALAAVAEEPGTMLDNLARAERLGWIADEEAWLSARELRNRLVHEYMTDTSQFATDLRAALENVAMFAQAYDALLGLAGKQFGVAESGLAEYLQGATTGPR